MVVTDRYDTFDWNAWEPRETAVLTYIRQAGKLLLIEKKIGLGAGKVSAPGGRLEARETLAEAAVREVQEEVGLTPTGLRRVGYLEFIFTDGYSMRCYLFTASGYSGTLRESDEAAPFWCDERELPYARMWADDELWLPLLLEGVGFVGRFVFDGDQMVWHRLRPLAAEGSR